MDEKVSRLLLAAETVLFRHNLWMNSQQSTINPPQEATLNAFAELKEAIKDLKGTE